MTAAFRLPHYARTARAIARDAAPVARDAKPPFCRSARSRPSDSAPITLTHAPFAHAPFETRKLCR